MPINGIKPTAEHQRICQQLARNIQINRAFSRPQLSFKQIFNSYKR
jgi:hypothetical protein